MAKRIGRAEDWRKLFVGALLASTAAGPVHAAAAAANSGVEEIVVTATKRSESLQKVPVSVQALGEKTLEQHQVTSFDDYAKLLPSVSFQSFGPGQAQPYFRGITSGDALSGALHSGSEPGTGVYLDETPVTTVGNGLDIHLYDISRVEALSGPQGTLFGANSLSGTLRIITNPPNTHKFSAAMDVEGNKFGPGGFGGTVEGYVNVPITDKIAIRLVGFDEHDGGYVDNVLADRAYNVGVTLPTPDGLLHTNNARFVKKDYNDVDTWGGRAALKVELDDNWTVTPQIAYQHQRANGNFLYNPALGYLKVSDFSPEYNIDRWYQAALTIQGKIANWDVIYSGGYFARQIFSATDYSYYAVSYNARGLTSYVSFPDANHTKYDVDGQPYLDPNQHFSSSDKYTKENHEFRLSSPKDFWLRLLGGVFYERQTDAIIANYQVSGLSVSGDPRYIPGTPDDIYFTDLSRIDRDFAVFGELAWDILPNLTATIGGRYFTVNNTLTGVSGFVGSTAIDKGTTEYGETHKYNLSWKIDPNHMVYATYSTGFRPGGVNRRSVLGDPPQNIGPYQPDTIANYEIGWKTTSLGGRLRINGALFDEEWHKVQYALSPPGANGITAIFNVGYARSQGVEADVTYHPDDHWTFSGSGTLLNAKITKTFCTVVNSDGTCGISGSTYNYFVYSGQELPIQPHYKVNMTARYEFDYMGMHDFVQGSMQAQGGSRSALVTGDNGVLGNTPAFQTFDFSGGVAKDFWTAEAFVTNAFGSRATLGINVDCSVTYCGPYPYNYPTKPQLFGIKLGVKY